MEKPEKDTVKSSRVREKVVAEAPKPVMRSDADSIKIYQELLTKAPDMPIFINMEEVTSWLDKVYRPFLQAVRHEMPK